MSRLPGDGAAAAAPSPTEKPPSDWSQSYGEKHRFRRITEFPAGMAAPSRVRIYWRHDHYLLQWWSRPQGKNVSERITGDLLTALVRAREIDQKLEHFPGAATPSRRCDHSKVVEGFLEHLRCRAEAGEVQPATVERYRTALDHFLAFVQQGDIQRRYPHTHQLDRDFRLAFTAFLASRRVAANGQPQSAVRPMRGQAIVLDTLRAMLEWAADPDRGNLLPDGFRNPFLRRGEPRTVFRGDPLSEPDISLPMAIDLMKVCDRHQLLLFAPLLLFGLRAGEPCFLFREYLDADWLRVPCNPDLEYRTKGRRDKRFPLIPEVQPLWEALRKGDSKGLLFLRRDVRQGYKSASLLGWSLSDLIAEFRRRCAAKPAAGAADRQKIRDAVLQDAGAIRYDHVQHELGILARKLGWPATATLKDLRHLFATTLGNSAMPEAYRRYLMGQNPGNASVVAYTHLNRLREHYGEAVRREWAPLVEIINRRVTELA